MTTMRNRKTIIVAFVLVACMLIGVGYAALSTTLNIKGSANIHVGEIEKDFTNKIYFTAGEFVAVDGDENCKFNTTDGANKDEVTPTSGGQTADATFTLNHLAAEDNYAIIKYTIKNESDWDAKVTVAAEHKPSITSQATGDNEYFAFQYSFDGTTFTANEDATGIEIDAGNTKDVWVKVSVEKPVDKAVSATFVLKLTATQLEVTP